MGTCIEIKNFDGQYMRTMVSLGGGHLRRALRAGEVLELTGEEVVEDGRFLLDALLDSGLVEISRKQPTRPLEFLSREEANYTKPFIEIEDQDTDKLELQAQHREAVQQRVQQPVDDPPTGNEPPPHVPDPPVIRRRGAAAKEQATDGREQIPS